jgi:hypothetical protein
MTPKTQYHSQIVLFFLFEILTVHFGIFIVQKKKDKFDFI